MSPSLQAPQTATPTNNGTMQFMQQHQQQQPLRLQLVQILPNGQQVYMSATEPAPPPLQLQTLYIPQPHAHMVPNQVMSSSSISTSSAFSSNHSSMSNGNNGLNSQTRASVSPPPPHLYAPRSPSSANHGLSDGTYSPASDHSYPSVTVNSRSSRDKGRGSKQRRSSTTRSGGGRDGTSSNGHEQPRDAIWDEFRSASSKGRDWTIQRIQGHVVDFCRDQNGSRFIQQRLEAGSPLEQHLVAQEVVPAIVLLRNDVFGNYVVQKLLEYGTVETKRAIGATMQGEMRTLSLQMYGCRIVQKALETLDDDDLVLLVHELHGSVASCMHDQNGNHVIQKCIEVFGMRARQAASRGDRDRALQISSQMDFIINAVLANATMLSCHPYGCRVVQRILEHATPEKTILVLNTVRPSHQRLLDDQYGNFVIQHVLQYGRQEDRDSIVQVVRDRGLLNLARQKFASNVVEKLLKHGNDHQRRAIVREMLQVRNKKVCETNSMT
jgi:pumilio RNA-binding family